MSNVHGCLPGIYRGTCYDNLDVLSKGRIRISIPPLFGDDATGWAWPCSPTLAVGAHARIPNIGEGVFVMFEAGDPDHPIWMGVYTWQP
jgi:hypothetical protein